MTDKTKTKTIFRVASRHKPYSQLGNAMIRDKRLSRDARFALIFILTYPPNWKFNLEWLASELGIGRNKTYKLISEMVELGYCAREPQRDSAGRHVKTDYYFTDEPGSIEADPLTGNGEVDTPDVVSPHTRKRDTENSTSRKQVRIIKKQKNLEKNIEQELRFDLESEVSEPTDSAPKSSDEHAITRQSASWDRWLNHLDKTDRPTADQMRKAFVVFVSSRDPLPDSPPPRIPDAAIRGKTQRGRAA